MKVVVITCSPSALASDFLEAGTCDQTVSVDVLTGDGSLQKVPIARTELTRMGVKLNERCWLFTRTPSGLSAAGEHRQ
jgi:hypothetical protein